MRFPTKTYQLNHLTPQVFAICLLLAACLQIMENLLPKIPIFPWLRLGLAYLIILPFLLRYGAFKALMLFVCRNLIALVYGGQIFSSFMISTLSGVFSVGIVGHAVYLLYRRNSIGVLGVSLVLACSFNVMQLIVVNLLFVQHGDIFFQLAPLLIWSLFSSSFMAFLIYKSRNALDNLFYDEGMTVFRSGFVKNISHLTILDRVGIVLISAVFISLFFLKAIMFQLLFLAALLIITQFKKLRFVFYAWPFFFYIAWLHLFRTDGIFIYKDWITREGLDNFLFFTVRTANVIICGQWLGKYIPLLWRQSAKNLYLEGMGYALPMMPAIFGLSISMGKTFFQELRKRNLENLLQPVIERLMKEFEEIDRNK